MTEATSPIGKLNLLRQCHKEIVGMSLNLIVGRLESNTY